MALLYAINIAAAVALLFWPAWFARVHLRLPWVNPFTILLTIALPVQIMKLFGGPLVLIDAGLFDTGYQYALLMGNLHVLAQTAGLVFFYGVFGMLRIDQQLPLRGVVLSRRDLRRGARAFLLLFAVSLFLLASAEFGVINWFVNPREGYQLYRTGQGHWYALAVTALSTAFLLAFLARPAPKALLFNMLVYIALGYLLGSKGMLLAIFGSALAFLWFLRWPYLGRFILLGTPALFGLLLVNLFLMADGFDLQAILEYFDFYKNAADYYNGYLAGEVRLFLGEITWSNVWGYVPRAIWPDKPVVYGILLVNEIFYPGQAELTNTPAFAGAVEQFADFGVAGVLVFGFFSSQSIVNALLAYLIFRRPGIRFDQITLATVLLMLVQYAPAFGSYFPAGLYLLLLFAVLVVLRLLRRSRRRTSVHASVMRSGAQGTP
ncbi:MAG: hypothetical protein WA210_04470 [Burkholderiaceae bacterium]